ncbi:MAG: glycoside hydrolase family 2 TIM barrel-domain containing protein [Candidatus Pseudobacter hemicellulosilyticus]|uniref:Glycoside hydrolase family 2 TIM barrel-domain containing protein n=1 Tax=Candidatus Pseudobacter hemicellulosilyticus TaxID=3121375 RepID=A0AAJ5WQX3_9BACT|nr:MAG: glycoside hydrolase family 2 TIM barrel-domain containing protein [Pseudobacter sp.]
MKYFCWIIVLCCLSVQVSRAQKIPFSDRWQFCKEEKMGASPVMMAMGIPVLPAAGWQSVNLPHTAHLEPQVIKDQWVGVSWYRKDFTAKKEWRNKQVFLQFEGAMQTATVWLNGKELLTHTGGYLPFSINIGSALSFDSSNVLLVKLDNQDSPLVPPGKPLKDLDFCYYSGIYRNVSLLVKNDLFITDPVMEAIPAGGGLHVWYPHVSARQAEIQVATHIRNAGSQRSSYALQWQLLDKQGRIVAKAAKAGLELAPGEALKTIGQLQVNDPQRWYPDSPNLYTLKVQVRKGTVVQDEQSIRIGIRKFDLRDGQFYVNDQPILFRGTNRHQEYPYIGNALSDNAQYRDAVKIKSAGFNLVRLSHYPQADAFMDACDELGLLTIPAIPGWQFIGNETFMEHAYVDAQQLMRRDRNHASAAIWELSLNETPMPDHFMQRMVAIAKEESPAVPVITGGWIDKYYDVYFPARQHGKFPDFWKKYTGKMPLFTAEYGDWEYFAQDAGLNQANYAGLKGNERSSRQLRGDGEKRLQQQATNFQEAHNDNLQQPHLGDANWLMFDYNRGYSPDIESSGIMDISRLPKFAYYFYKSQAQPGKTPLVSLATWWNEQSDPSAIKVYSNCEEVALYLNGQLIERKKAIRDRISDKLPYPPFVFSLEQFTAGELKAIGYIGNRVVATDKVTTAGKPAAISLRYDHSGRNLKADGADIVFVYATVTDANRNPVYQAGNQLQFAVSGQGKLVGPTTLAAEAGIATVLLQSTRQAGAITVTVSGPGLAPQTLTIRSQP